MYDLNVGENRMSSYFDIDDKVIFTIYVYTYKYILPIKGTFCDSKILILRHLSEDINKTKFSVDFELTLDTLQNHTVP